MTYVTVARIWRTAIATVITPSKEPWAQDAAAHCDEKYQDGRLSSEGVAVFSMPRSRLKRGS